ncbi:hypothetical protein RRG08_010310 [Elysia crispata]|uniref:Uncharacterized protein n=1 Tax=Elysia crispata TaxID=231223 RepID=A0AAE0XQJ7_9GAST|nr:hypothetical protein RRG08_010310 [Elysia crispata]
MALVKNYPPPYMRSKRLLKAAYEGDMKYVESVVPSQINVNQPLETRLNGHSTYLHTLAVDNNQVELLHYCLSMGADALLKGIGGVNLFSRIASSPHVDKRMVDMLFYCENGGEFLNDQTTAGNTIAHAAVLSNNTYCLSSLLSMSDVVRVATVRNKKGDTPLHLALKIFSKDNPTVPVMLVKYALRVSNEPLSTTDDGGFTAFELACRFGFSEVVDLIIRHRGGYSGGCRPTPKPRSGGGGGEDKDGRGRVYEEEDSLDDYEEDASITNSVKVEDEKVEGKADITTNLVTMAQTIDELTTINQSLPTNLMSERSSLMAEMQCLSTEEEKLASDLSDTKASVEAFQKKIDLLRKTNLDLHSEVDKYQSLYNKSSATVVHSEEMVKNISMELETARADLSRQKTVMLDYKKSLDNANRLAEQAHAREVERLGDQFRNDMQQLKDTYEDKITYLAREKDKINAELKRELNDLHEQFDTELQTNSQKHDERMTAALKDHEAEVKVLEQRYEDAVTNSEDIKNTLLEEMSTLRMEKNKANQYVNNVIEENKLTVGKLKKELSAKNKEMMKLKNEFGRLQRYALEAKQYMEIYMMPPQQQMVYCIPPRTPQQPGVSSRRTPPTSSDIDDLVKDMDEISLTTTKPTEPK